MQKILRSCSSIFQGTGLPAPASLGSVWPVAKCLSWKCWALPVHETTQTARHAVGTLMRLQDQALQLMLLAAEGLPGGWAGPDWVLEPELSGRMFLG